MWQYVLKRLVLMIPTILGAAFFTFFLLRLMPGDVCEMKVGADGGIYDPAAVELCRENLGLNRPIFVQFGDFVWGIATFDYGDSMWTGRPIMHEVGLRFELSLQVALMATAVSIVIAIPLGTISAVYQNSWIDLFVRTFSIAGIAIPSFWLGIMIILAILSVSEMLTGTRWSPPIEYVPIWEDPWYNLSMLIWPALATGYRYSAVATRMTRSSLLEVLREDYIRTARAKGLMEKLIINRHALGNAMLPVVTIIGIEFAFLMGGLVVTEQVFNLNGLGRLLVQSVTLNDFAMTQAIVMIIVLVFVVTNFFIDILYGWLDPRIRYR
ncbi:MAG TPA: ABC transporter permease [Paracoccaceae bacterium]|nr:ABC transporter permease [Paracoccaceae bacterium]